MLPEEQAEASRYFYELASARFGWSWDVLAKVQAFHFKGGQGAKTGTGGHLPGDKVKGRIAEVRGLPEGTPAVSPRDLPRLALRRRLPPLRRRGARAVGRHPDRLQALGPAHRGRHRRRARGRRRLRDPRRSGRRHRRRARSSSATTSRCRPSPRWPGPGPTSTGSVGATSASSSPAVCATPPTSPRRWPSAPTPSPWPTRPSRPSAASACGPATPTTARSASPPSKPHLRARLPVDEAAHRLDRFLRAVGRADAGAGPGVRPLAPDRVRPDRPHHVRPGHGPPHRHRLRRRSIPDDGADDATERRDRPARAWYKVAELDELPDGRVKTVHRRPPQPRPHPRRRRLRRARQPLPAPGRPARRGLDREGHAALPVARLRLRPAHRHTAARLLRRPGVLPARGARRRRLRRDRRRAAARAHRLRRHGRDDGRVGRHPRLRHGRPLEPRVRRRHAPPGGGRPPHASSASATRARPRSPRRPTPSSPAGRRRASASPDPARPTCSPASTTPRSTGRRCWPSRARCRRRCSAGARSRTSTSPPRSPTSPGSPAPCCPTPTTPS